MTVKLLSILLFLVEALEAARTIVSYEVRSSVIELCKLSNQNQNELIGVWVKQNEGTRFKIFTEDNSLSPPSGYMVEGFGHGHIFSDSNYMAPPDGTFMWFGIVMSYSSSKQACQIRAIFHDDTLSLNLTLGSSLNLSYYKSYNILSKDFSKWEFSGSGGSEKVYLKKDDIKMVPYYFTDDKAMISYQIVLTDTSAALDDTEMCEEEIINIMKYGRNTQFMERRSFQVYVYESLKGFRYGVDNTTATPISANQVIRWRIDHPSKTGLKIEPGNKIFAEDTGNTNCGRLVTFHVYNLAAILASTESDHLVVTLRTEYRTKLYDFLSAVTTIVHIKMDGSNLRMKIELFNKNNSSVATKNYDTLNYHPSVAGFLTDLNPLVVIVMQSWRPQTHVDMGNITHDQYTTAVRFTNRPWTPPNNYIGVMPGNSYELTHDDNDEIMQSDTWRTEKFVSTLEISNNLGPSTIDYDVRVAAFDVIHGIVRPDELVSGQDIVTESYNDNCILPIPPSMRTTKENTTGVCEYFSVDLLNTSDRVYNCSASAVNSYETCDFCNWTSPATYTDASGGKPSVPQLRGTNCRLQVNCTGEYTFVTTAAITTAAIAGSEVAQMKPSCVECPHQCSSCQWDNITHKLQCNTCYPNMTLQPNGADCNCTVVPNCMYCGVSKCDLCLPTYVLYIGDDDVRVCRLANESNNCTTMSNGAYNEALFPRLINYDDYRECFNCSELTHTAPVFLAIEEDYNWTRKCIPNTTDVKGLTLFKNSTHGPYFAACPKNCRYCRMDNPGFCIQCVAPYVINGDTGSCMDGTLCNNSTHKIITVLYEKPEWTMVPRTSNSCLDCSGVSNCAICNTTTTCKTCNLSYFVNSSETCQACPANCTGCTSSTDCHNCTYSLTEIFHPVKNVCQTCDNTTHSYVNSSDGFCYNCFDHCKVCTSNTSCQQCKPGYWILLYPYSCVSPCPVAMSNHSLFCHDCPINCRECDLTSLTNPICISCKSGYSKNKDGECLDCTLDGYVLNLAGICMNCPPGCKRCTNDTQECTECKYPKMLASNKSCIEECQAPAFINQSIRHCVDCEVTNCIQCETANRCKTCDKYFDLPLNKTCELVLFKALKVTYDKNAMQLTVSFNTTKMSAIDPGNVRLQATDLQGEKGTINLTLISSKVDSENTSLVVFSLQTKASLQEARITISFDNTSKVVSEAAGKSLAGQLNPNNKTLSVEPVLLNWPPPKTTANIAAAGGMGIATVVAAIVSFNSAIILIKIYQMMDFMLLYNAKAPANFMAFISIFASMDPTAMMPDMFASLFVDECSPMGEKFMQQNMRCQFLQNASLTITLAVLLLFLIIIVRVLYFLFRSAKSPRLQKVFAYLLYGPLGQKGFYSFLTMFDIDIFIAAATNNKYYAGDEESSMNSILNNLVSATLLFGYPLLLLFYFVKTRQLIHHQEGRFDVSEDQLKKWGFLTEGRKEGNWYTKYCEIIGLARNYLISVAVVGLYDSPYPQMICCLGLLALSFGLSLRYRPYETKMENITTILAYFFYSMCTLFFIVARIVGPTASFSKFNVSVGWPMIITFSMLVATNMLPSLLLSIYKLFMKLKSRFNKQKKLSSDSKEVSRLFQTNEPSGIMDKEVSKKMRNLSQSPARNARKESKKLKNKEENSDPSSVKPVTLKPKPRGLPTIRTKKEVSRKVLRDVF